MSDSIPKKYATEICRLGQMENCCRYLAADQHGLCCLKATTLKDELDKRAAAKQMNARSDNCAGWEFHGERRHH